MNELYKIAFDTIAHIIKKRNKQIMNILQKLRIVSMQWANFPNCGADMREGDE